ncbi:MAG: four helix bundle protein [Acidobacteriota bacterium]|nr:four helix bundle protein [Acidobacteriota bacterium]
MEEGKEARSKNFQDVETWKKAHQWVLGIYKLTECFPKHELFGLTSQLRRAAVSVPANIAEEFKRQGKGDKIRFYNIAQASLEECRYYLILSQDLNYAETAELADKLDEVSRMLDSYIAAIAVSKSK